MAGQSAATKATLASGFRVHCLLPEKIKETQMRSEQSERGLMKESEKHLQRVGGAPREEPPGCTAWQGFIHLMVESG